jgi:hypothetical protein
MPETQRYQRVGDRHHAFLKRLAQHVEDLASALLEFFQTIRGGV